MAYTFENLHSANASINEYIDVLDKSVVWVKTFEKGEKKYDSFLKLKSERIELKKINQVIEGKPVIALFGASQVGKSYMADNLLKDAENKTFVLNHQTKELIDYQDINPVGEGNEATGAITRFISEVELDIERLPVKVKIFNPVDIVCIIIDTVYNDFKEDKKLTKPSKAEIDSHLANLKNYTLDNHSQIFLSDDDVFKIKEYFENYSTYSAGFINDLRISKFWEIIAENIQKIPYHNWSNLFKILWYNKEDLNIILDTSLELMQQVNFESELYIDFKPLLRASKDKNAKYFPIIDVENFHCFFEKDVRKTTVQTNGKKLIEVHNSHLGFLTQEIVLTVSGKSLLNKPFINDVDVIDFPGARSRDTSTDFENKIEMIKRGKVAYLFNKYSDNYQTNILTVCFKTSQTDVKSVPILINNWIEKNLGTTPEIRSQNIQNNLPPLFIVNTFWNTILTQDEGSNVIKTRITNLFERRIYEEITSNFTWHNNWLKKGDVFNNFYMLRSFKFSKSIFKYRDGIEVTDTSDAYTSNEQAKFIEDLKGEFIKYHQNTNIFPNPNKYFDEASTPGKDGSEWIIENLLKRASRKFTVPVYVNKLVNSVSSIDAILSPKYHIGGADEAIKKNNQNSKLLRLNLNIIFDKNPYLFGNFIEHFVVTESEIVEFYHTLLQSDTLIKKQEINGYILIRVDNPSLSPSLSFDDNLAVLQKKYSLDSKEDAIAYFNKNNINLEELFFGDLYNLQNNSTILAEKARDYWFDKKLSLENFKDFKEHNLNEELLIALLDVYKILFAEILKIQEVIAMNIRQFVDVQSKIDKAEDMIAHITAGLINKFVTTAGWDFYTENKKEELFGSNAKNSLELAFPKANEEFYHIPKSSDNPNEISIEKLLDYMDSLNENLNKKPIDTETAKYVPMISHYQQWLNLMHIAFIAVCDIPNYDVNANNKLGEILNEFKKVKSVELV
jgi:hypothetical protein